MFKTIKLRDETFSQIKSWIFSSVCRGQNRKLSNLIYIIYKVISSSFGMLVICLLMFPDHRQVTTTRLPTTATSTFPTRRQGSLGCRQAERAGARTLQGLPSPASTTTTRVRPHTQPIGSPVYATSRVAGSGLHTSLLYRFYSMFFGGLIFYGRFTRLVCKSILFGSCTLFLTLQV